MGLVNYIDLVLQKARRYITFSLRSLMSSIFLLEAAASISTTSIVSPFRMDLQASHSLQGLPSCGFKQFTALEKILAEEVFPDPLIPEKI